jgi:hypothetical protein
LLNRGKIKRSEQEREDEVIYQGSQRGVIKKMDFKKEFLLKKEGKKDFCEA